MIRIENRRGFHGREPGSGERSLAALAFEKHRKSVTSSSIPGRG